MSKATATKPRLRWRKARPQRHPHHDRPEFDLWYGDGCVMHLRWDRDRRTFYFYGCGGRNSLVAGERYPMPPDAKAAAVEFVRGELACDRPLGHLSGERSV